MNSSRQTVVTVIPPTIDPQIRSPLNSTAKRRVAGYARVSTDSTEQESSFDAQVDYFTTYINEHPDWQMVEMYTDEGISATNTKHREGFKRMMADALAGKIDLILTKSVSRFARNTVDSLNSVRELKAKGVEVWFQKENIYTFDGKGELLITIMSSLAQEESRSISENVTWGQRKRMQDGKVNIPYARFLGYEKGPDGRPKVVESEAKVVRLIFDLYLQGLTINRISKYLTEQGIPTPGGKEIWGITTINSILKNEKYKGDAELQKTFTVDFLEKIRKKNEGEIPKYYVTQSHPHIIEPAIFDLVQEEKQKRQAQGKSRTANHFFTYKVFCGQCGGVYGPKLWSPNDRFRRIVWQCNEKYKVKGRVNCRTPHLSEDELKNAFLCAMNQILLDKETYISNYDPIIEMLTDTSAQDEEITALGERVMGVHAEIKALVDQNAHSIQNQDDYQRRYDDLVIRYEDLKARLAAVDAEKQGRLLRKNKILHFLDKLRGQDNLLNEFDEPLFRATVDSMIVHTKDNVVVKFRDGREIAIDPNKKQ